jgi:hypothetical protein
LDSKPSPPGKFLQPGAAFSRQQRSFLPSFRVEASGFNRNRKCDAVEAALPQPAGINTQVPAMFAS